MEKRKSKNIYVRAFIFILIFCVNETFGLFYPANLVFKRYVKRDYTPEDVWGICLQKQRFFYSIMEMYEEYNDKKLDPSQGMSFEDMENLFLDEKYLKYPLGNRPHCKYELTVIDGKYCIYCTYHGGMDYKENPRIPAPCSEALYYSPEAIKKRETIGPIITYTALLILVSVI